MKQLTIALAFALAAVVCARAGTRLPQTDPLRPAS